MIAPTATVFSELPVDDYRSWNVTGEIRARRALLPGTCGARLAQKRMVKSYFRSVTDEKLMMPNRVCEDHDAVTVADLGGWQRAYPEIVEGVWKQRIQNVK
jgi:hypothetical protein